jgi:DNA repair protein RadC
MRIREATVTYSRKGYESPGTISDARDAVKLLRNYGLHNKTRENLVVVYLDSGHNVLAIETAAVGGLNSVAMEPREVFRGAIMAGAAAIIMAHNHPTGSAKPSNEDLLCTTRMEKVGKLVGCPVLDHLVVCDKSFTSIKEHMADLSNARSILPSNWP